MQGSQDDIEELRAQVKTLQRAIAFSLPYLQKRGMSLATRTALRDAGVRLTLRHQPCPRTGLFEESCTCDLHADDPYDEQRFDGAYTRSMEYDDPD